MTSAISFAGTQLELHGGGFAWFPEHQLLCASDIHFEKGSYFQRFSTFLPPYDTHSTLASLREAIERFNPRVFISLGDAFHDNAALERMHVDDRALLAALIKRTGQWLWVEGNHDPDLKGHIGGTRHAEFTAFGIAFRHIAETDKHDWELSGHFHPKARVVIRGHTLRTACFVASGKKLMMPAFGSYTGGLDVTSDVISAVMPLEQRELYLLHKGRVFKWQEPL